MMMFFFAATPTQITQNIPITLKKTEPSTISSNISNYIIQSCLFLINFIIIATAIFCFFVMKSSKSLLLEETNLSKNLIFIFLIFAIIYSISSICVSALYLAKILTYNWIVNIIYVFVDILAIALYLFCNYLYKTDINEYTPIDTVLGLVIIFSCLREIVFLIFFIFFDKFPYYYQSLDQNNKTLLDDNNTKQQNTQNDLENQTNNLINTGYTAIDNILYNNASNMSIALNSQNINYNTTSNNNQYALGNFIRAYLINIYNELAMQVYGSQLNKISQDIKGGSSTVVKSILQQIINQYITNGSNNIIQSLVYEISNQNLFSSSIDSYYSKQISTSNSAINNSLTANIINSITKNIETQIDVTINNIINNSINLDSNNVPGVILAAIQNTSDLQTSIKNTIQSALNLNNSMLVSNVSNYIIQQGFSNLYQNNKQITIEDCFKQTISNAINNPNTDVTNTIEKYLYNNVPVSSILKIIANYVKQNYTDINLAIQMYCAELLQTGSSANLPVGSNTVSASALASKAQTILQNAAEYSIASYLSQQDSTLDVSIQDYFLNRIIGFNQSVFTTPPANLTIYNIISQYLQLSVLNQALTTYAAASTAVQGGSQTNADQDIFNNYNNILQNILNGTNTIKETVLDCLVTSLAIQAQQAGWNLFTSYLNLNYDLKDLAICILNDSLIDSYFTNTPQTIDPNYSLLTNTCSCLDIFFSQLVSSTSSSWNTLIKSKITTLNTTPPASTISESQAYVYGSAKLLFGNLSYCGTVFADDKLGFYTSTSLSNPKQLSLSNSNLSISKLNTLDIDGGLMNQPVWTNCTLQIFNFNFVCNSGFGALNPITDITKLTNNLNGSTTAGFVFSNNDVIQIVQGPISNQGPNDSTFVSIYGSKNFAIIFLGNGSFLCFNDKSSFYAHPNMIIYQLKCPANVVGAEIITPTNISSVNNLKATATSLHSSLDTQITTLQQTDATTFSTYQTAFMADPTTPFPTFNTKKIEDMQQQLLEADTAYKNALYLYGVASGPKYSTQGLFNVKPLLTNNNINIYTYDTPVNISSDGTYSIKIHQDSPTKISTYILLNNNTVYHQVFDINANKLISTAAT